jgi:predicted nucleic acid-binding protein
LAVEWGGAEVLARAQELARRHKVLGLVDSVVITVAERLKAEAIATLDLRHFGAVPIRGNPKLLPRDL